MALLDAGREMWGEGLPAQPRGNRRTPAPKWITRGQVQDGPERRTIEGDSPVALAGGLGAAEQGEHSPRVALLGSAA